MDKTLPPILVHSETTSSVEIMISPFHVYLLRQQCLHPFLILFPVVFYQWLMSMNLKKNDAREMPIKNVNRRWTLFWDSPQGVGVKWTCMSFFFLKQGSKKLNFETQAKITKFAKSCTGYTQSSLFGVNLNPRKAQK